MTKGEKKALLVVGGITLVGGAGLAIYFATRPKKTSPSLQIAKDAVQGAVTEGTKPESDPTDIPDAEKLQQAQQQQTTPPPKITPPQTPPSIQLLQNLSQIQI